MTKIIAIQADPVAGLNRLSDSTLMLAEEAQARGFSLHWYAPQQLSLRQGVPVAQAQPFFLTQGDAWYRLETASALPLQEVDVVLMRQDPPFDMAYLTATYMLERLPGSTQVVNHPTEVRNNPEKLFPLTFSEFTPPTLISADVTDIRAFHREHEEIVLKPLYSFGGRAVFHIRKDGSNLEALLEMMFTSTPEPLIAQRFLPEVTTGERRIVLINGEVAGVFGRLPAKGEIRSNLRIGGTPVACELTPRQRAICEAVGPVLKKKGLLLAGLDTIGDWLTEINVTSPTGLRAIASLYGTNPAALFWDALEK